jgi:hypothetical protein
MKQFFKSILLVFASLILQSNTVNSQNVSIEETLKYLNEIFASSESTVYMYDISFTSDGQLNITRKHKYYGKSGYSKYDNIHMNVSDITQADISKDMAMCDGSVVPNTGGKHIILWCKNKSDCIYDPQSQEKYTCNVELYLDISDYDYQRALNAVKHLLVEGKKLTSTTEQKGANDPFAPKVQEQTNQKTVSAPSNIGPCTIKTINRSDGTTVQYFNPEFIGKGSNFELGMAAQSNGENYFLSTTVRYLYTSKKVMGKLQLHLSGNQALILNLYKTEITSINNENVGIGMYYLTSDDILKLKKFDLLKVVFQEADGKFQIVVLNDNQKIVQRQINCLTK